MSRVETTDRPMLDATLVLLEKARKARLSRERIAKEAGVGYVWLCHVVDRRIENPGVQTVQRVFDYLTAKEAAGELVPAKRKTPPRKRAVA